MSETAKSARAAMKAKAQRLGGADRPLEKVDSSSWTPPEMLNSTTKTGARPLTRRAYKSGGKVKGAETKARADRPARKSGDAALSANSLINRNVKDANAEREGAGKHIGAFKKGGRAQKCEGGSMKRTKKETGGATDNRDLIAEYLNSHPPVTDRPVPLPPEMPEDIRRMRAYEAIKSRDPSIPTPEEEARMKAASAQRTADDAAYGRLLAEQERFRKLGYKKGGRTGKLSGGPLERYSSGASVYK
jgi:hypothetical protein